METKCWDWALFMTSHETTSFLVWCSRLMTVPITNIKCQKPFYAEMNSTVWSLILSQLSNLRSKLGKALGLLTLSGGDVVDDQLVEKTRKVVEERGTYADELEVKLRFTHLTICWHLFAIIGCDWTVQLSVFNGLFLCFCHFQFFNASWNCSLIFQLHVREWLRHPIRYLFSACLWRQEAKKLVAQSTALEKLLLESCCKVRQSFNALLVNRPSISLCIWWKSDWFDTVLWNSLRCLSSDHGHILFILLLIAQWPGHPCVDSCSVVLHDANTTWIHRWMNCMWYSELG